MTQPHPDRSAPRGKRAQANYQVVPPQRHTTYSAPPSVPVSKKSRRWPWMAGVVVAFVAGVAVGSSGGASAPSAPATALPSNSSTSAEQLAEPASAPDAYEPDVAPAAPTPPPNAMGSTVVNGGIAITVKAARTVDSIQMNESNFRPGSGLESYTKTTAGADAKYVVVETHVANNAKTSIDLTCSLPVKTALVDTEQRNFDPIDDLYKLKGNPECNDNLQPGFESDMTWVYRVPASTTAIGWGFQDITDLSTLREDWTTVRLEITN